MASAYVLMRNGAHSCVSHTFCYIHVPVSDARALPGCGTLRAPPLAPVLLKYSFALPSAPGSCPCWGHWLPHSLGMLEPD